MNNLTTLFRVNTREAKSLVKHLLVRDLVPLIKGSPGGGKSAVYRQVAESLNLFLVDIRISAHEPQDIAGYLAKSPDSERYRFMPLEGFIPTADDPIPEGYSGFLILLDEVTHGIPEMIRALYGVVLDKKVGFADLHPNAVVALAGNRVSDNALATNLGTAFNSRVTHLELSSDPDVWLEDVAIPNKYDYRVIGFINYRKDVLNDFDPDIDEHAFCCERTWESVSRIIDGVDDVSRLSSIICGTISPGVGAEFIQFCSIYGKDMPSISAIINNPDSVAVPSQGMILWAVTTYLARKVDTNNAASIATYMSRVPVQYMVIFLRMVGSELSNSCPEMINLKKSIGVLL